MFYSIAHHINGLYFNPGTCVDDGKVGKISDCINSKPDINGEDVHFFMIPINKALNLIGFLAGILAVAAIILIGVRIIAARAGNNPDASAKALGGLLWIAVGLILILGATQLVDLVYF